MTLLSELNPQAIRIAKMLREKNENIAVADGATGGLIAASLLTVPGALDFFMGGGVVYSLRARTILFNQPDAVYRKMRGVSKDYAILQAKSIRSNFGSDWGLAESGSAGGSCHPTGAAAGRSCVAIVGPNHLEEVRITDTKDDKRITNMENFSRSALQFLEETLSKYR